MPRSRTWSVLSTIQKLPTDHSVISSSSPTTIRVARRPSTTIASSTVQQSTAGGILSTRYSRPKIVVWPLSESRLPNKSISRVEQEDILNSKDARPVVDGSTEQQHHANVPRTGATTTIGPSIFNRRGVVNLKIPSWDNHDGLTGAGASRAPRWSKRSQQSATSKSSPKSPRPKATLSKVDLVGDDVSPTSSAGPASPRLASLEGSGNNRSSQNHGTRASSSLDTRDSRKLCRSNATNGTINSRQLESDHDKHDEAPVTCSLPFSPFRRNSSAVVSPVREKIRTFERLGKASRCPPSKSHNSISDTGKPNSKKRSSLAWIPKQFRKMSVHRGRHSTKSSTHAPTDEGARPTSKASEVDCQAKLGSFDKREFPATRVCEKWKEPDTSSFTPSSSRPELRPWEERTSGGGIDEVGERQHPNGRILRRVTSSIQRIAVAVQQRKPREFDRSLVDSTIEEELQSDKHSSPEDQTTSLKDRAAAAEGLQIRPKAGLRPGFSSDGLHQVKRMQRHGEEMTPTSMVSGPKDGSSAQRVTQQMPSMGIRKVTCEWDHANPFPASYNIAVMDSKTAPVASRDFATSGPRPTPHDGSAEHGDDESDTNSFVRVALASTSASTSNDQYQGRLLSGGGKTHQPSPAVDARVSGVLPGGYFSEALYADRLPMMVVARAECELAHPRPSRSSESRMLRVLVKGKLEGGNAIDLEGEAQSSWGSAASFYTAQQSACGPPSVGGVM